MNLLKSANETGSRRGWLPFLGVFLLCLLPLLLTGLGVDFGAGGDGSAVGGGDPLNGGDPLKGGTLAHTVLEWSALCTALFIFFLSLAYYYRVRRDVAVLIFGAVFLWSGCMDAFYTLAAGGLIPCASPPEDLIPFTWALCRSVNALLPIAALGVLLLYGRNSRNRVGIGAAMLIGVFFGVAAIAGISFCATRDVLPATIFPDSLITHPWESASLVVYLLSGVFVYPLLFRRQRKGFVFFLWLSVLPNAAAQLHMAFGSSALFDHHFFVSHAFKVFAYLLPFAGILSDYVRTFREEKDATDRLGDEIAGRERAQKEFREHRDWLETILSSIGDAVVATDVRGVVTLMNPMAEQLTGWDFPSARGRRIDDVIRLVDGRSRNPLPNPIKSALEERGVVELAESTVLVARDGREVPVDDFGTPIRNKAGRLLGAIIVFRDITGRRSAEDTIIRAKKEWERTFDSVSDFIAIIDCDGKIIRLNTAMAARLGTTPREAIGISCHEAFHGLSGEDGTHRECIHSRVMRERREYSLETHEERLGGDFHVTISPFYDGRDKLVGCVHLARDITERKRMEKELEQAREQEVDIGSRIQQSLLIDEPPSHFQGLKISAFTIPSQRIDGDFYTFFEHDERCLDIIIGDVMGKGIPAALIGAATKNHFLSAMSHLIAETAGKRRPKPEDVVSRVKAGMAARLMELESFVTLCYARFDLGKRLVTIVDCGHPKTLFLRRRTGECHAVEGWNMPLGFSDDDDYRQVSLDFEPGDSFFFYSDGVIEAQTPSGELFGEERLTAFLRENRDADPAELTERIPSEVIRFAGSEKFADDLTCIAVKVGRVAPKQLVHSVLEISSSLDELGSVRNFVRRLVESNAFLDSGDERVIRIELAVNEAASNIMRHAYGGRQDGKIRIEARISDGRVTIDLYHWGIPFCPDDLEEPDFEGGRDGGFGCYVIEQCFDEVSYVGHDEGGSLVSLVKNID
jgi:phosphoserine phosphatase RsbU/P